jgi:hypothetical protein
MAPTHLVHSHAQEGDIPGTVNLQAAEGDDTGTSRDVLLRCTLYGY